jgi:hypothetical protein
MDCNNQKDRGSQRQNRNLQRICHTDYYGVSRSRAVLDLGSIRLFSGVYCAIYAYVRFTRSLRLAILIRENLQLLYIPRIMLGGRRHRHTVLFVLHTGPRRRDTAA